MRLTALLMILMSMVNLSALDKEKFKANVFKNDEGKLNYRLFSSEGMKEGEKYPLILTFHGSSSCGDDNISQLRERRGPLEIMDYTERTGKKAFILSPQCPGGQAWVNTPWYGKSHTMPEKPAFAMKMTLALLDKLLQELPVDKSRIYVTGLSLGGFGTWDIIQRKPDLFAAAIPVCGGGDTAQAGNIKNLPIWIFHGDSDNIVYTKRSRDMFAALKKVDAKVQYTEYKNTGHDSFTETYKNDKVLDWFFSQKK
ncbi:MAG: prolyl oligopeptidase family serine peptidase [Lentisphaeraceae bacterium]|nr:prolyl oligopeptidase family serine peptidase [Lentisphaeraceae bacterium]